MQVRPALIVLTLAVAAAHAWLLAGVPTQVQRPAPSPAPQIFATRTVPAESAGARISTSTPKPTPAQTAKRPPQARTKPVAARQPQAPKKSTAPAAPEPVSAPLPVRASVPAAVWQMPSSAELIALGVDDVAQANSAPASADDSATVQAPLQGQALLETGDAPPSASSASASPRITSRPSAASQPQAEPALVPTSTPGSPETPPAAPRATPEAAPQTPVPILLPAPRRLNFEVTGRAKGLGYSALAELLWEHDATSYRAHQEVKVLFLGSRSQTSVGSITPWGLQPRRFGDKARSERAAHFDFAAGRVSFSANTPSAPIAPGAQDRLSVFLQLGAMLAAAPERYPPGTDISMTTVSARGADVWTFAVQAEETLNLPLGNLAAVPLTRLPRREYDQKAQVWLAPTLGYLPARIRITEANGDFVELNLRSEETP